MKVLILANDQKWKSWDKKIQELKDWFKPAVELDIELLKTKIKKIPFVEYGTFDGFIRYGIDKTWFKETLTDKFPGYDIIIFSVNRKDWDGFPVEGWQWGGSNIAIASNEGGSYNFKGVNYPGGKWFNIARHEICHALYVKQGKFDRTHFHWDSGDLSKVLTELQAVPTVTITRNQDDGTQTLGELEYNGLKLNTLELSYKDNKRNISSIPKGTYNVKYTFSPKFMKYTYEILNVPGRSGIRIHTGNYFTDIQGCILLGNGYKHLNKDNKLDIINSTVSVKTLEQLLNKQPFKLIIK